MTNEEAINCIDDILESPIQNDETLEHQLSSFDFDWLEKAKAALEKQIPKKPNGRYCPTCGYGGLKYDKEQSIFVIIDHHHCNSCGQAIDWSGEVEE